MPQARVDGRRVAWREAGRGEPALLIHCALAHSGAWWGVMQRLEGSLAMRAMDLPGHGGTEADRSLGIQDQATANALALLSASGPAHLIGHSFGATVALRVAVQAPQFVRSLTLVEPVMFGFLADAGDPAYAREVAQSAPFRTAAEAGDWPEAARAFLARWGAAGASASAAVLERIPLLIACERDLHDGPGRSLHLDDIAGITAPALLVEGTDSPPVVHAILDAVATRVPAARRVSVPGAAHMLPVTHPDTLATAILDHLATAPAPA
jgi:pimeloyl-ACP methyl ester carboxylesterase